jgi:hypothetical protein
VLLHVLLRAGKCNTRTQHSLLYVMTRYNRVFKAALIIVIYSQKRFDSTKKAACSLSNHAAQGSAFNSSALSLL